MEAVGQHHERWDGSGYPARMQGEDISPFARIIAMADTYFEMVSRRPGREAYMPHEAVEFILAYNGVLFDPELVQIFTRLVPLYPTGTTVRLNTGELGIICDANMSHIGRPVMRVCFNSEQGILAKPYKRLQGNVLYGFTEETAKSVIRVMVGEDDEQISNEMGLSAIGEIANIITGNAATKLASLGYVCDISPPVVIEPVGSKFTTV